MAEYTKPWLSIGDQLDKLESRGVDVSDRQAGALLLSAVGYYRVTGYLYPLRESEPYVDANGRKRAQIHNNYRAGTTLEYAEALINFDRQLRMLILDGIERIEISLRTQLGHVLGRQSGFAHLDPTNFVNAFTDPDLLGAMGTTLVIAAIATTISIILGTLLALGLERYTRSSVLDSAVYFPLLVPDIVLGIALLSFYSTIRIPLGAVSIVLAHSVWGIAFAAAIIRTR